MELEFDKDTTLRIAGIMKESIVDGEGYRYSIFTQGCPHNCRGCHNPQTHGFQGGRLEKLGDMLREVVENPLLSGVTFSGGEPFCQPEPLAMLAQELHSLQYNVWCYTGYTYEQLLADDRPEIRALLENIDVLVDGPFILEQRDLTLAFRGSQNQRLIDIPASLEAGTIILYEAE